MMIVNGKFTRKCIWSKIKHCSLIHQCFMSLYRLADLVKQMRLEQSSPVFLINVVKFNGPNHCPFYPPILLCAGPPFKADILMKSKLHYFADWESEVFGYGYGDGEYHIIQKLKSFLDRF